VRLAWPFGLLFAVGAAVATNVGFLMRHRGAVEAPDVDARRPVRTTVELFRRRWWTLGFAVAVVAWLLQVVALRIAPLSLVQAALASGFVVLGVIAERFFGFHVGRRQWIGIGLTTSGLALLALTAVETKTTGEHAQYAPAGAIAFEAVLVAASAALLYSRAARDPGSDLCGPILGAGAGLLYTVSHVGVKALTGSVDFTRPSTLLTPWVPVIVAAFVAAFFASARSLQVGEAVPVIAITSSLSNVSAILAGIVVFGDPVGSNQLVVALRIAAFALVVVAAALMPAPVRAAEAVRRQGERGGERVRSAIGTAA